MKGRTRLTVHPRRLSNNGRPVMSNIEARRVLALSLAAEGPFDAALAEIDEVTADNP